jgi:hypothetical protein
MFTRNQAKAHLKALGWTYRSVAPSLGVGFVHLCLVLNGHRHSRRLLAAIERLPRRGCRGPIAREAYNPPAEAVKGKVAEGGES